MKIKIIMLRTKILKQDRNKQKLKRQKENLLDLYSFKGQIMNVKRDQYTGSSLNN